jgi:hypothetical protein
MSCQFAIVISLRRQPPLAQSNNKITRAKRSMPALNCSLLLPVGQRRRAGYQRYEWMRYTDACVPKSQGDMLSTHLTLRTVKSTNSSTNDPNWSAGQN